MDAIDALRARIPEHSADLEHNLVKVLSRSRLSPARVWGCAITAAITCRSRPLTEAAIADARAAGVGQPTIEDARAAASLMAMTNTYYGFEHLLGDAASDYRSLPAALRMKRSARPAGDRLDYELFALAASVLGGCASCVRTHERALRAGGVEPEAIHDAVRIAATMRGVALSLWQAD